MDDEKTLREAFARAETAALAEARHHTDLTKLVLSDLTVGLPAHTGLLGGLVGTMLGLAINGVVLVATIPTLVVSGVVMALVVRRAFHRHGVLQKAYVSAAEAYWALLKQREQIVRATDRAQSRMQWMLVLSVIVEKAHHYLEAMRAKHGATDADRRAFCQAVLDALTGARHTCLRFTGSDETYNFHIFRWDAGSRKLEGVARAAGSRITIHSRKWNSGQGHVGTCFEENVALCLGDLQNIEGKGYRKQVDPLDRQLYRAIMDAPIPGGATPWGALVITSGRPHQFEQDDLIPVLLLAAILGTVLAVP